MNVNQRIVQSWLNNCKQMLTMHDITYSNFNAAIGLLAIDPRPAPPVVWDIEVKLRAGGIRIGMTDDHQRGFHHICRQLLDPERDRRLHQLLPPDCTPVKIFITNRLFLQTRETRDDPAYWSRQFQQRGITLHLLEDIILDLQHHARHQPSSPDTILQTFRLSQPSLP